MFYYDSEYCEQDWQHEADARELAELDADRRDMEEYPAPLTAMESIESKRYLAIGGMFSDEAGPIGMEVEESRGKRKKAA